MPDLTKNIISENPDGVIPELWQVVEFIDQLIEALNVERSENDLLRRQLKGCREGVTII